MLVCIDESGDSGFKFAQGSSEYFTCVAVFFPDPFTADACDRSIDEIRRTLKLKLKYEFHFKECSDRVRQAFFKMIAQERFTYYGFVLNKPRLYGRTFTDRQGFYNFTVGLICENAKHLFSDSKIIIDRCGDRNFQLQLEKSLKTRMIRDDGTSLIKRVTMEASHSNNLLQLADMICGAVARDFNSDKDDRGYYRRIIRGREGRVQFWPK
jgi:hypothetical protein